MKDSLDALGTILAIAFVYLVALPLGLVLMFVVMNFWVNMAKGWGWL